jgi:cytochrome c-type biogenesis protein CcmH/NrfF
MTIDVLIMFLGAFVAISPFLGFPLQWDTVLLAVAGVIIIALGIMVRRRGLGRRSIPRTNGSSYAKSAPVSKEGHEAA